MKKNSKNYIYVFLLGLIIFLYPIISMVLSRYNETTVVNKYIEEIKNKSQNELNQHQEIIDKYNEELNSDILDSTAVSYRNFLSIGDVIGYIEIPKINVNLPIYQGTTNEVLREGIGHIEKSSLPTNIDTAHVVLTGHTGLSKSKLFTDIDKLEENDEFYVIMLDKKYTYKVDQIKVVLPTETKDLKIENGKNYATLITCTPYMINTHRLLVRGALVKVEDYIDNEEKNNEDNDNKDKNTLKSYIRVLVKEIEYVDMPMIIMFLIKVFIIIELMHLILFKKQIENEREKIEKVKEEDLKGDIITEKDFVDENLNEKDFEDNYINSEDFKGGDLEDILKDIEKIEKSKGVIIKDTKDNAKTVKNKNNSKKKSKK